MAAPGISPRRSVRDDAFRVEQEERPIARPVATGRVFSDAEVTRLFDRLERSYDASVVAAAAAAAAAANAAAPDTAATAANHGILYLGLNPESAHAEEEALARTGSVRRVGLGPKVGGVAYDFSDAKAATEIPRFVDSLKLDPRQAAALTAAIANAPPSNRSTLAQLAAVFAEAEHGKPIPSRIVLSAHSGGENLFGGAGELSILDVQRLAACMPRAAACIEDIHLSACSTSGQAGLDAERATWVSVFPNLKTMWTYAGTSRLTPTHDLEVWGRATGQAHDDITVPADLRRHHVAVWSKTNGYHDDVDVAAVRKRQGEADKDRFAKFISGDITAEHRTTTAAEGAPLAQPTDALLDYEAYRVLSQRNDVAPSDRAGFAQKANQLLRIRYYTEGVRAEFAKRYGAAVKDGFAALGLPAPDFGSLDRKTAMNRIAEFEARLAAASPVPSAAAAAAPMLRSLRDLDPRIILETDCHH